jgi:hypothetical protein
MRETNPGQEPCGGELLAFQALLYASGELDERDALLFESRLAEEQGAREALSQAVQLCQVLRGHGPALPDPVWRDRVRQRLQPRRRFWQWLTDRRFYRGHPLAWSGLGAAAAVLLMLAIARQPAPAPAPAAAPAAAHEQESTHEPDGAASADEATAWAKLPKNQQFVKAEGRLRLAKRDEPRSHLPSNAAWKQ